MKRGTISLNKFEVLELTSVFNIEIDSNRPICQKIAAARYQASQMESNSEDLISIELSEDEIESLLDAIGIVQGDGNPEIGNIRKKLSAKYLEMSTSH